MNILWDFDGTIFDSYPVFTKIMKQNFLQHISEENIYRKLKVSYAHAIQYFHLSDTQMNSYYEILNQTPAEEFKPFNGVEKILAYANKNVIMTHSKRAYINRILSYYGWEKYFDDMVAGDDGFPRKPDPASYQYLHRSHSIDMVIGDRLLDLIPGKKIGAKTCFFKNNEPGADFYLEDYQNFFEMMQVKS
ncbi:HAD-IA family hydrolase [Bacillaceae bacterium Marseille-Q3522]|nr:HAD-IA family hydrolase [Bacillaceae bacterium Marseille-Q3522]